MAAKAALLASLAANCINLINEDNARGVLASLTEEVTNPGWKGNVMTTTKLQHANPGFLSSYKQGEEHGSQMPYRNVLFFLLLVFTTAFKSRGLITHLAGPTPTNISRNSEPEMLRKGTPASPAVALASRVFPVPGGPDRIAP